MPPTKRVTIVGSGPSGAYLGKLLKATGFEPIILEEHPEIGQPVQCSGVVASELFTDLKMPPSTSSVVNVINHATAQYKDIFFEVGRRSVVFVIDRHKFDQSIADGLDVRTGIRCAGFRHRDGTIVVETNQGDLETDILVGADGPNSTVRKAAGIAQTVENIPGLEWIMPFPVEDPHRIHVEYFQPFHSFGWIAPEGNGMARVGVLSDRPKEALENFVRGRGKQPEISQWIAGPIPIGYARQTVKGNVALVGDAAGQTKPITGGGISYGMMSAEILADCIVSDNLPAYDRLWKARLGRELRFGLFIRRVMGLLDERSHYEIFRQIQSAASRISKYGDFDSHHSVWRTLYRDPRFYGRLAKWSARLAARVLFDSGKKALQRV